MAYSFRCPIVSSAYKVSPGFVSVPRDDVFNGNESFSLGIRLRSEPSRFYSYHSIDPVNRCRVLYINVMND